MQAQATEVDAELGRCLEALESLRAPVLAIIESCPDESARGMWRGDARAFFLLCHAAADLFGRAERAEASAGVVMERAQSECGRVASELRALGAEGERLETALLAAFGELHALFAKAEPTAPAPPDVPIQKISPTEYRLLCAVCGEPAVVLRLVIADKAPVILGRPAVASHGEVECAGIVRSVGLRIAPEKVFGWLEAGNLAALHDYMGREQDIDGGLDAWCPQCALIYCRAHYNVSEEWDEGFYDCSRGTCPRGHTRLVDD